MSPVVVDLHCDTLLDIQSGTRRLAERSARGHVDLPRLREGGVGVQVFAAYVAPRLAPRGPQRARELIEAFRASVEASPEAVVHATTVASIEEACGAGKVAAVLSVENGDALGGRLEALDDLYRQGVRMLGLTWNPSNPLGDGVLGRQHGGLTDLGRAVVRRMEELGMVIDASHLSEASFWDLMDVARGPVVASHSNAWALHPHPRNLTDAQLRAIAQRGGVVGVNFYPGFLGAASLDRVLDHIEYMATVMGADHVALGSDYDGIPQAPAGLEDASKLPNLSAGLRARGHAPEHIHKILGGNALRVFRQVWA
ncbi:MAG: dipeptidase [Armatimonadota bacterium]|nr:dipeptidase [Armatimonadota bacterium]MDR7421682.1 dipeptidase [Armatimonadota bacterium]MDR7454601.1 dipeptidase [Armatimonadota bacterium]MDR7456533.1 dipeptidase [Armatimonadota bacterium]MDR7495846.1 dipeptidase [Armatimonadota bacterium]